MRYSIIIDGQLFRLVSAYIDSKTAVIDAIIHVAKGQTAIVERTRSVDLDGVGDHVIRGFWHVFAGDGYHLIEVLRTEEQ